MIVFGSECRSDAHQLSGRLFVGPDLLVVPDYHIVLPQSVHCMHETIPINTPGKGWIQEVYNQTNAIISKFGHSTEYVNWKQTLCIQV